MRLFRDGLEAPLDREAKSMKDSSYERLIAGIACKLTSYPGLATSGTVGFGRSNVWVGASTFSHQIDVSLQNETDVLLVECKHWQDRNVPPEAFLTMWARVADISQGKACAGRRVRGAVVTTHGFQRGVYVLAGYYQEVMSLFTAKSAQELAVKLHTHFIRPPSIPSEERFGTPSIVVGDPPGSSQRSA
jgi:hypothetical protein